MSAFLRDLSIAANSVNHTLEQSRAAAATPGMVIGTIVVVTILLIVAVLLYSSGNYGAMAVTIALALLIGWAVWYGMKTKAVETY